MKILQINAVGQISSTGRTSKELQSYINENTTYNCYTAFSVGIEDEYGYRIGNKVDRKIHAFLSRLTGKQAHFSKFATRNLLKYMGELAPDIVHLRNLHGNYINVPMLLKYLADHNIATVITLHDCWFFTGKCCYYTLDGCYKWKTGCYDCPRLRKDNESWFIDATSTLWNEKKSLLQAIPRMAVIGVSDWITEEAKQSFLVKAQIIQRIYNWISLDIFKPSNAAEKVKKNYGIGNRKMILGVSSKWSLSKGFNSFIELADRLPDTYQIVIVGKKDKSMAIPKSIIHIPGTDSTKKLAELYSAADVFVTFSLEETFGKVSAEALSCGTPVICYDSTANKELVGEGCGAVLPAGDIGGVCREVQNICSRPKETYIDTCRRFAERMFDKETNIKNYINIYEKLMQI